MIYTILLLLFSIFIVITAVYLRISEKIMEKQYNYPAELSVSKHAKDLISRFLVDG